MTYIYDILLNYNNKLYDFYEWNLEDDVCHIRKTPLFKIKTNQLIDIAFNKVRFDLSFLQLIKKKTEIFTKNDVKVLNYVCLFSDGDKVVGVKFDHNGLIISKSSLLPDEEDEVTDMALKLKLADFNYTVLVFNKPNSFKTRKECEIEAFIDEKISKETNLDKLKYLYFECFNKVEKDQNKIIKDIKYEIKNNWETIYPKIYNFYKLVNR